MIRFCALFFILIQRLGDSDHSSNICLKTKDEYILPFLNWKISTSVSKFKLLYFRQSSNSCVEENYITAFNKFYVSNLFLSHFGKISNQAYQSCAEKRRKSHLVHCSVSLFTLSCLHRSEPHQDFKKCTEQANCSKSAPQPIQDFFQTFSIKVA